MSTSQRTAWLNVTVFLTGAGLMTVELVASRLIARYLGSSLYTWTGVLGVILAGMSLGNYLGGRMADAAKNLPGRIAAMFFAGAVACIAILWLNAAAGASPRATRICHSTRSRPVIASVTGCSTCRRVFISIR